jgi:thiamine-phosphate pyrophosphorylase
MLSSSSVDYAIAGPAYESVSKPGYGPALGPAGLAAIVHATSVPIIAIGGIAAANVPDIMGSGVAGIAIMGGVMRTIDPASEVGLVRSALAAYRARD